MAILKDANLHQMHEVTHRVQTFFKVARLELRAMGEMSLAKGAQVQSNSISVFPPSVIYAISFDHNGRFEREGDKWFPLQLGGSDDSDDSVCPVLYFERECLMAYLGAQDMTYLRERVTSALKVGQVVVPWEGHGSYLIDVPQKQFLWSFVHERLHHLMGIFALLFLLNALYYGGLRVGLTKARRDYQQIRSDLLRDLQETQTQVHSLGKQNKALEKDAHLLTLSRSVEERYAQILRRRIFVDVGRLGTLSCLLEEAAKGNARLEEGDLQAFLGDMTQTSKSLCSHLPHLLDLEQVSLATLAQECISLLQYEALKGQVEILMDAFQKDVQLRTDALLLTLILLYVLKRTFLRMYCGQVFVSFVDQDGTQSLSVRWQGEGVREEHFIMNEAIAFAGVALDERLVEEICKKLHVTIKRSDQTTSVFFKNLTSENPFSSSCQEMGKVIPLFA